MSYNSHSSRSSSKTTRRRGPVLVVGIGDGSRYPANRSSGDLRRSNRRREPSQAELFYKLFGRPRRHTPQIETWFMPGYAPKDK